MSLSGNKKNRHPAPPRLYVGEWIARLGHKAGKVAIEVGITESYLSEIISGKKAPRAGILFAIADHLGITVDHLRHSPPPKIAVEATRQLAPMEIAALGHLLDQIKSPPRK